MIINIKTSGIILKNDNNHITNFHTVEQQTLKNESHQHKYIALINMNPISTMSKRVMALNSKLRIKKKSLILQSKGKVNQVSPLKTQFYWDRTGT